MIEKQRWRRGILGLLGGVGLPLGLAACAQIADDLGSMTTEETIALVVFLGIIATALVRLARMTPEERACDRAHGGGCGRCGDSGGSSD